MSDAMLEILDEAECRSAHRPGGIGRLVFAGRYDLTVLPVNYKLHDGAILFRTAQDGSTDEDLRTGIAHAEYRVAFEVDDFDPKRAKAGVCWFRARASSGFRRGTRRRSGGRRRAVARRRTRALHPHYPGPDHRPANPARARRSRGQRPQERTASNASHCLSRARPAGLHGSARPGDYR